MSHIALLHVLIESYLVVVSCRGSQPVSVGCIIVIVIFYGNPHNDRLILCYNDI